MTQFFYRVEVHITTFGDEPYYYQVEEFTGPDLLQCRQEAVKYYNAQLQAIESRGQFYGKKFSHQQEFKFDENAAYSLNLVLVEQYTNEFFGRYYSGEVYYCIAGESEEETILALEFEKELLHELYEEQDCV